jgi:hypothetical protein
MIAVSVRSRQFYLVGGLGGLGASIGLGLLTVLGGQPGVAVGQVALGEVPDSPRVEVSQPGTGEWFVRQNEGPDVVPYHSLPVPISPYEGFDERPPQAAAPPPPPPMPNWPAAGFPPGVRLEVPPPVAFAVPIPQPPFGPPDGFVGPRVFVQPPAFPGGLPAIPQPFGPRVWTTGQDSAPPSDEDPLGIYISRPGTRISGR